MSLTVEGLTIRIHGRMVLDGLGFDLKPGARMGPIGEPGSG